MSAPSPTAHDGCTGTPRRVLGPVALHGIGTRGAETRRIDATEQQWDKDRPAYKRLRHQGYQPPNVDGAAELESHSTNEFDVNTGLRYGNLPEQQVKEGIQLAEDSGWVPSRQGAA